MTEKAQSGLLPEVEKTYHSGQFARAEKWCRLHLASNPDDLEGKTMLAAILAKKGECREAIALLEGVLAVKNSYEAQLILSTLLFSEGDINQALTHAEEAILLDPRELGTYNKTGRELVKAGGFDRAVEYFQRAVEYGPDDVGSNQNLAAALKDAGRHQEALDAWLRVVLLAPKFGTAWLNLGMLHLASHRYDAALEASLKAIACDPKSLECSMLAGLALSEMGRAVEAETYFRSALRLDANHPLAQASLGVVLQEQGYFDESATWLHRSLKHWESNGLAYYVLVRSRKIGQEDLPFLETIHRLVAQANLGLLDRSYMEYALGKAYEDLKDFEKSISHFDLANEAAYEFWFSEKPWDAVRYRSVIQGTIDMFSSDRLSELRGNGVASDRAVLIVGMIRSGTSLVEQILSSHPEVAGAGELPYWHENSGKCFDLFEQTVDLARLRDAAEEYLKVLEDFSPSAKRVTDKMPHNYAMLGLIYPAMPNARIIHIRRNPLDNCLSVYTTGYSRPPGFTLKRENIVTAYKEYLRLVEHWRETLPPDRFLEVDYEDLVSNREHVTRLMIEFIGLDWDDLCLQHERNQRTVHTPSTWQVRQPIYKTSVEKWKNYESWLGEFGAFAPDSAGPA